jgi:F-type H+-transporting ATPase subunit delta
VPARRGVVADVLSGSLTADGLGVLQDVAAARWSSEDDLVEALETLAAQAAVVDAGNDGVLDRVEDELFRFGRAVESSPQLQLTLTDPALSAERKAALVTDLVGDQAAPATTAMLAYAVGHLHGRAPAGAVAELTDLAATQRNRVLAEVESAIALSGEQQARLTAALERLTGRRVKLHVEVTPDVVGGIVVRVGDEVIDGSLASRLEQARRAVSA